MVPAFSSFRRCEASLMARITRVSTLALLAPVACWALRITRSPVRQLWKINGPVPTGRAGGRAVLGAVFLDGRGAGDAEVAGSPPRWATRGWSLFRSTRTVESLTLTMSLMTERFLTLEAAEELPDDLVGAALVTVPVLVLAGSQKRCQVEHHRVGVQGRAVVELHIFAEGKRPRGGVGVGLPAGGQARNGVGGAVFEVHQRVVNLVLHQNARCRR